MVVMLNALVLNCQCGIWIFIIQAVCMSGEYSSKLLDTYNGTGPRPIPYMS